MMVYNKHLLRDTIFVVIQYDAVNVDI